MKGVVAIVGNRDGALKYKMNEPENQSCYEYMISSTSAFGDYDALQHFGHKIKKSKFIKDIDSLAHFFLKIGFRQGEVFTIFLPTCVQGFAVFYALNKIGVISNNVHPLTSPELLEKSIDETGSKGIIIFDVLSKKYVSMLNRKNIPCIICSSSDYAGKMRYPFFKLFDLFSAVSAKKIKNSFSFNKIISTDKKEFTSQAYFGNGEKAAAYLHGGGTTDESKTIILSSRAINELVFKLSKIDGVETPGRECSPIVLPMFHAFGLCVAMHMSICNAFRAIPVAKFKPKAVNRLMKKYRTSFIVGVPNMYKKLMEQKNFEGKHLRNLRLLFCGGDDVREELLVEFNLYLKKYNATGRLQRGYGLTEVSSVCCVNTVGSVKKNSIGRPLQGIRMEIWDENYKKLPPNTEGEIVVSGSTLMNGYLDASETENGIFVDENNAKWVLTGDVGCYDEENFFYFKGRKKRVIIISGYNIYPSDIERQIEKLSYVSECCAVQGINGEKSIIKLFVILKDPKDNKQRREAEIQEYSQSKLPLFSRPGKIYIVDNFPRTAMSKIDYKKLQAVKKIEDRGVAARL